METANVIIDFFSSGTAASVAIALLSIVLISFIFISRNQKIEIAFYEINSKLRNKALYPSSVFHAIDAIPLKRVRVSTNADVGDGEKIDQGRLDAYIETKIASAENLSYFYASLNEDWDVKNEKKEAIRKILMDSLRRMLAAKLAAAYSDCIFQGINGTYDFHNEKNLITEIIMYGNVGKRDVFFTEVMKQMNDFLELPDQPENEIVLLKAAKVNLKKLFPEMIAEKQS